MADSSDLASELAKLKQDLKTKKTFVKACQQLSELCEKCPEANLQPSDSQAFAEVGKAVFTALQTRFSNPKFWQAGLDVFLALEFHMPAAVPSAEKWREVAMEEVDEDAREKAKEQARLRRLQEDKKHNKGLWSDANTPVTAAELAAASGLILINEDEDGRPAMSRDARAELRLVTVFEEDVCVVCQEALIVGSKAKSMPCNHLFHDECLESWVQKNNSCPTCRYDELPSEKRHFDDVQRQVQASAPGSSPVYS
eukprot:TRINITY_DN86991_c0_g1_i1.p1 TRINITY_DN86991_c0_g1~~TRINITY_DN86991_c0_g1_i1.p1  ORF type:complete len:279 (-),score=71.67 TRINITY_DN86991_c0_g1_i1:102-863(-)